MPVVDPQLVTIREDGPMQDAPAVPREERHPYPDCPACGMISEPDSADHRLTPTKGTSTGPRP
jgi:hypothetical protein